ncbi:MAG: response regulator transcription factor [Novosphingobium sp.]
MRIAVADDQAEDLEGICNALQNAGYTCTAFTNGDDVIAALRRETFDLLLLDWNMPRSTGLDVLVWVTENLPDPAPVIMLTNRDSKEDVIRGLESGATDFIVKPTDPDIVSARIAAALRRRVDPPAMPDLVNYGDFTLDRARQCARFGDEVIELRAKEFELTKLLFDNINRPLSRNYIMARIWNTSPDVETRTLDMHISRIRSKLQLRPERGVALRTVFGFGYRLDSCPANEEVN